LTGNQDLRCAIGLRTVFALATSIWFWTLIGAGRLASGSRVI
jgi:hypothetical protein